MRLLVITARYHPFIGPRAHRWTSVAEHWATLGHEVHVVCARRRDCPNEAAVNGVQMHRAGFDSLKELGYYLTRTAGGRGRVGAGPKVPGWLDRAGAWLYTRIWKKLYFPDDAMLWYLPARRKVLQLLKNQPFDAVISVSLPFTGHLLGLAVKRRCPNLRWLADIGDPFTIQPKPLNNAWLYGRRSRRLEQKILTVADVTVVTTDFARKKYAQIFGRASTSRMIVIPPLLHPEPDLAARAGYDSPSIPHSFLHLGYFGAFYAPVRTPDALLDLMTRTFDLHAALHERVQLHVYGEIFPEFLDQFSAQPAIRLHGLRPREEVRAAMDRMDILLHVGNTTDYQLPSKAAEYLASGKPVVHLSYVEDDPFVAFWGDMPGLLTLKIEGGRVETTGLSRWLEWLENGPPRVLPASGRKGRIGALLINAVADDYAAALLLKAID